MRVYVANCSQNYSILNYRLLEVKNPLAQPIEPGNQVLLAKPDLNMLQVNHFVEQMRPFGLYTTEELVTGTIEKNKLVQWLVNLEKPMTADKIQQVMVHNAQALHNRGVEFRKAAAITANGKIGEFTPHAAGTMEITIQEESQSNSGPNGDPLVAEGYRIERGA